MSIENLFDTIEEEIMDLLARIDDGDEEAIEELKKAKKYFKELADMLSVVNDDETVESMKKKFDMLSKKFDDFLMTVVKVVG